MTLRKLLAKGPLLLLAMLSACGTLKTYPGPERPDAELAVLHGYHRIYLVYMEQVDISAVDGKRVDSFPWSVSSVPLLPGQQWIEITKQIYFGGSGGYTVCAFESNFEAQHRYQLKAHSSKSEGRWYEQRPPLYKGSISMKVAAAGEEKQVVTLATLCAQGLPSFCLQDSDCSHHPNYECRTSPAAAFGVCESPDR
jgi:hypothetical protein